MAKLGGQLRLDGANYSDNSWAQYNDKAEYRYIGCYNDTGNRALPNYSPLDTSGNNADKCYDIAKANSSRYFGLQYGSECWYSIGDNNGSSNPYWKHGAISHYPQTWWGRVNNYVIARDTCSLDGGSWANQVYRVRTTQKDIDDAARLERERLERIRLAGVRQQATDYLNGRLSIIIGYAREVDSILPTVTTVKNTITPFRNDANTACNNGDNLMNTALEKANDSLSYANLALQNAESARILSQDLKKQTQASDMSDIALANATLASNAVTETNTNIANADAQYQIVRSKSGSIDSAISNIPTQRSTAQSKFNATRNVSTNLEIKMLRLSEIDNRIDGILRDIEYYAGKTQIYCSDVNKERYNNEGLIHSTVSSINSIIDNDIGRMKSDVSGYVSRANDKTKKNTCDTLTNQTITTVFLAEGQGKSIKESTKTQLIRIGNLEFIEKKQQADLAAADEIKAVALKAEYAAADAAKSKRDLKEASIRATKAQLAYERSVVQNNSINKQNSLLSKINSYIFDVNNMTTIEGFTNTPLATGTNQEINNYVKSFNNSLSLLDDPNNMNKAAFDTYLHIQDTKLASLNSNLNNLKKKASENTNKNAPIKGIRSMHNSAILNVEEYPSKDSTSNKSKYLIYGNNGCLEYGQQQSENAPYVSFKPCNANEKKQQFNINQINNLDQYNNPITNKSNENYKINNKSNVNFGFYSVNPINGSDQCLQLNNDGISVMPCNMDRDQRFSTNYHSVV
jgi:hypothetical protein